MALNTRCQCTTGIKIIIMHFPPPSYALWLTRSLKCTIVYRVPLCTKYTRYLKMIAESWGKGQNNHLASLFIEFSLNTSQFL